MTVEPRCPDFDEDCKDVECHISCWLGGERFLNGTRHVTFPAKGYCPFLRGDSSQATISQEALK